MDEWMNWLTINVRFNVNAENRRKRPIKNIFATSRDQQSSLLQIEYFIYGLHILSLMTSDDVFARVINHHKNAIGVWTVHTVHANNALATRLKWNERKMNENLIRI